MNTKPTSSGSSTTSSSVSEETEQRLTERRPSVKKIVIMPKLHQTIMVSILKSRDASESPNRVRYLKSARATKHDLSQACTSRDRPMTQPSSTLGVLKACDWRQMYSPGHLTNSAVEWPEHIPKKKLDTKSKPTPKFGRVKNARDYIQKRS